MAIWTADVRYLASIYSTRVEPVILAHGDDMNPARGRSKRYWIPPIPRTGKPSKEIMDQMPDPKDPNCAECRIVKAPTGGDNWVAVVKVNDSYESVPDIKNLGLRLPGQPGTIQNVPVSPSLVTVEEILVQLTNAWRDKIVGLPTGAQPGILVISGTQPTLEEYNKMIYMQTLYYEYEFMQGESQYHAMGTRKPEDDRELVRPVHRDAATWLGQPRNWSTAQLSADKEPCPLCGVLKPSDKAICHACGHLVKELPEHLARLNPALVGVGAEKPAPGKPVPAQV